MNKILLLVVPFILLTGCATMNNAESDKNSCKRYVPITENSFKVILATTMIERAYASYSIGMSELIILENLKNDFEYYYEKDAIGEVLNRELDRGKSCEEAFYLANSWGDNYSLGDTKLKKMFHDFALLAMASGQKRMLHSKLEKTNALKIIDETPINAIKNKDMKQTKNQKIDFQIIKNTKQNKQSSK